MLTDIIIFLETPFGQVPVLEFNGKKINQSMAIARYLAKVVKLAGNDDWEDLEIDAVVDTIKDFRFSKYQFLHIYLINVKMLFVLELAALYFEQDEAKKTIIKDTLLKETVPYYLSRLDTIAQKNKGHLALGRVKDTKLLFIIVLI